MCPKQSFARIKAYIEVPMKLCQRIFLQLCKLFYSKRLFLGKGQTLRKDDSCDSTFWPSAMGYLFLCSCSIIISAVATSCPPFLIPKVYTEKATIAQMAILAHSQKPFASVHNNVGSWCTFTKKLSKHARKRLCFIYPAPF